MRASYISQASLPAARSKQSTVHFSAAFRLGQTDDPLPPGDYEITTDEELIEGVSHLAYRRVATLMRLPAIGDRTSTVQMVPSIPKSSTGRSRATGSQAVAVRPPPDGQRSSPSRPLAHTSSDKLGSTYRPQQEIDMSFNINTDRARQGNRGRHVLIILGTSLVLLMAGWFAVETFGESIDGQPTQTQTSQ